MRANHWLQFGSESLPVEGTGPQCDDPEIQKQGGGWVKTYVTELGDFQTREQFFRSTRAMEYAWSPHYADLTIARGWDRAYLPN